MASLADIFASVRLDLDTGKFVADAGKAADTAGDSMGKRLTASIKRSWSPENIGKGFVQGLGLAGGLGAVGLITHGVQALGDVIGGSITAASDLNETLSKSRVIFGDGADAVETWGDKAAKALGLSKNAAVGAAATFGNLFKSLGVGQKDIAPMSEGLVGLAADLASFNNIPVEDALQKLQSGIVGEIEPMRSLGVAITAATVDAKAAELGFKKVNGVFTEGQKVQARYALIFEQTKTAQGDFAKTSDGLANSQRILNAEWENTQAKLGTLVLPIVLDLTHAVIGLADAFDALSGAQGEVAKQKTLDEILFGGTPLTSKGVGEFAEYITGIKLLKEFGIIATDTAKSTSALTDQTAADMEKLRGVYRDASGAVVKANNLMEVASDNTAANMEANRGRMGDALGKVRKDWGNLAKATETAGDRMRASWRKTVDVLTADVDELADQAFDPLIDYQHALANNTEIAAQKRIIASKHASDAEKADARSTLLDLEKDQASYLGKLAATGQKNTKAYRDGIAELRGNIAAATGPTKTLLQGILTKLQAIDSINATPTVTVKIYGAEKLTSLAQKLGFVGNQDLYKKAYGRARGGPVEAGMPYIVGDGGRPELFVPKTSGTILPSVPAMGHTFNITLNGVGSDVSAMAARSFTQRIADGMAETLREQTARRGAA